MPGAQDERLDDFVGMDFTRAEWAALRAATPLDLTDDDLAAVHGIDERVALDEVVDVYLPLSRLLNLHIAAAHALDRVADTFLGRPAPTRPYLIGLTGSVAVGKSTTARLLRELLARWPDTPSVALVTTDGFLLPNAELERRGIMERKGFPESFDTAALLSFVAALERGEHEVRAPLYSHVVYDVTDEEVVLESPDVVILEGVNVLAPPGATGSDAAGRALSDHLDFMIYVDAAEDDVAPAGTSTASCSCATACSRTSARSSGTSAACPMTRR